MDFCLMGKEIVIVRGVWFMYMKTIVLNTMEFKELVKEFGRLMCEKFADKDLDKISKKEMREFLSACFEELLSEEREGVDKEMIFVDGKWREVDSGRQFVEIVNGYYGWFGLFVRE
jgi:hypothetical protein